MCEWRDVQGCTGAARSHRSQEAPYLTFPRKRGEGISFFVERAAALPIPSPACGGGLGRGPLGSVFRAFAREKIRAMAPWFLRKSQ